MTAQELKNSILQRAIEGKLVEQRAEEGTGEELYKLIQKEKKKLIKIGTLKKQKALPEIKEDEIHFEIPKTWKWVRLPEIAATSLGKTLNKSKDNGYLKPYLCSINVYWEGINLETVKEAKFSDNDIIKYRLQKGDLLVCEGGDVGRSAVWNLDYEMYYQNALHNIRLIGELYPYFYKYCLELYNANGIINKVSKGVTIKHLVQSSLHSMVFPLPPLAEQKRIVEKLEELMPLVERYDESWQRLEDLDKRFPETLKKSLLQEAIKGRLVEQKAEEGTGEDLYKLIQKEKKKLIKIGTLKKQKALPEIKEDEIPFEIPKTWKWVRLGEISDYSNIKRKIKPNEMDPNIWTLDLEDIEKDTGFIINRKLAFDKKIKGERVIFDKGQILFSKLRPYLKKIIVAPDSGICSSELVPFSCFGKINSEFLVYLLKSPFIDRTINLATYGVKMPRVGTETMVNLLLPLPPLAEQKRIVEKLEELMPLCEQLTRKTK